MRYVAALLTAMGLALAAPPVYAAPPISEGAGHIHHVDTGAGCVEIDAVKFLPGDRGLHQGADSSTTGRGPWHGPC